MWSDSGGREVAGVGLYLIFSQQMFVWCTVGRMQVIYVTLRCNVFKINVNGNKTSLLQGEI